MIAFCAGVECCRVIRAVDLTVSDKLCVFRPFRVRQEHNVGHSWPHSLSPENDHVLRAAREPTDVAPQLNEFCPFAWE